MNEPDSQSELLQDILTDEQIAEDVRWLASTPQGRRIGLLLIFIDCGFDSDSIDARASAQRAIGLKWWNRFQNEAPREFLQMEAERIHMVQKMESVG